MNRVSFGEGACEKTRKYLDSYINSELTVETNHEVLKHLEGCAGCSTELDAMMTLRARLKAAVKGQTASPELESRVREKIRSRQSDAVVFPRWAMAIAASVLVSVGSWAIYSREKMPEIGDRPSQNAYIQKISATLAPVLRLGLGDHVHCAVFRKYPKNPPPVEQMEKDLGPEYAGLLPVVRSAIPPAFRVVLAHQCTYAGRKYTHFTFEKGGELVSLVVARKGDGESIREMSQAVAGRYRVSGFEAGSFLAYVVSDLAQSDNLQIATVLEPAVRGFLSKIAS